MEDTIKWLEDKKVDFQDLIAWLILKWKVILLVSVIGCVLGGLICFLVSGYKGSEEVGNHTLSVDAARKLLSDAKAAEVENAFNDYQIYQHYNKELGSFSSVFLNSEKNDGKIMVAKYYILSRLKYCNSFYTDLAITSEDYKRIYEIAYPDVKEGENPAAKVLCPIQFISERDESSDAAMGDDKGEASLSDSILITAFIKADTEEQCNQILDVINSSFEKETQKLKGTDHGITCTYVDGGYISDQNNFYDNAEKMVVDRLDEVNKALNALDKKYADSFSKNQKEYFDALKVAEEKTAQGKANADSAGSHQKKKKPSMLVPLVELLKYAGIGFLVGLVLILYLLIVIYALSGTVKSYKELGKYGIQTLDTSYFEKSSSPVFRFARFVRRITPSQIDRQLPMLAEDISIMMKHEEVKRLYILMTTDDAMDVKVANTLKELIGKNGFQVASGNALEDIDELRILSESDRVVILAHMKKSMKHAITKAGAICERSDKKIYGFIAIEEC